MPTFDSKAPRLDTVAVRLDASDLRSILPGAQEVCSSIQDNDSEIWRVTLAGQLIRTTGEDQDRHYVFDRDDVDAIDMLTSLADDEALAKVWSSEEIVAFSSSVPSP